MKHLPTASKTVAMLLCATLLVACSSNETNDAEEEARLKAEQEAAEAARLELEAANAREVASAEELVILEEAAASHGTVFYFEYDSATLTPAALDALNAHIALLHRNTVAVRLEGHTDERGTREYNLALGERRANSVRDYMIANGISGLRIETVSLGEERPVAYGAGDSNWAQNRRVELVKQ